MRMAIIIIGASAKGLYWKVWCTAYYEGDKAEYMGIATKGKMFNMYYEDGAENYWTVSNFDSPDEAAYALAKAIREPPNTAPHHKDIRRKAECNLEFSGVPRLQEAK